MTVNVYHKHSVVKDKAPDVKQAELGELLLNANQDSFAVYLKDSADTIRKVGGDIVAIEEELKRLAFVLEQIQDITDILDNLDGSGLEKLMKALAALEAQVVLLAQHNVEQDKEIDAIQEWIKTADVNINEIAKNVADLQEQVMRHKINIEQNENRLDILETLDVGAGFGIKVERTDAYKFKVSIDEDWLEAYVAEALKPYALIDFGTNTDDLP